MKKILITGSCGFLAGSLIRKIFFEKLPYQVASIDNLKHINYNQLYWNRNHVFYLADICDEEILERVFKIEAPDIVIHTAIDTSNSRSLLNTSGIGTINLINQCKKTNAKLIFTSTNEVYGPQDWNALPKEDTRKNPTTDLAIAKSYAEDLIINSGIKYSIIRFSKLFGPRQNKSEFIPKAIKDPENCEINAGDIFQWCHVFDACSAMIMMCEHDGIYNVGSNAELYTYEVLQKIASLHSLKITPIQKNGGNKFSSDFSKLEKLGWERKQQFKNGINSTFEWYMKNQWVFKE